MQTMVSRRSVLKGATVGSIALSLEPLCGFAHAQTTDAAVGSGSLAVSSHVVGYVADNLGGIMSKARKGTATKQDIRDAASHLRLLSTHLSNSAFDNEFNKRLPDPAPIDFSKTAPAPYVLQSLQKYDPTMTQEMFWPSVQSATTSQVQYMYNTTKNAGFSGIISNLADQIHRGAGHPKFKEVGPPAIALSKPLWSDGVYRPGSSALHATPAQSCITPTLLQQICHAEDVALATLGLWLGIVLANCEANPAAESFCAALAVEVAAIGWSVGATLAVGIGIAAVLLLLVC
jgi:hypothetical protein